MDWLEGLLMYGLPAAITTAMMAYLNQATKREIKKTEDGLIVLRMNRVYQILGIFCMLIVLVFIGVAIYYQEKEMYLVSAGMLALFGGMGLPCLLFYVNHQLRFNDEMIFASNWLGKDKTIKWTEIEQIKFSPISGYIKIRGANQKMTIHYHLVGLKTFIQEMEAQTKWKAKDLKLPI